MKTHIIYIDGATHIVNPSIKTFSLRKERNNKLIYRSKKNSKG